MAHGAEGGLVHQVCQVGTHRTGGGLGNLLQVNVITELNLAGVHLEGIQSALEVGAIHDDAPVKPAGTQQRLVQNLRAVGGGQAHDTLGRLEAVNFIEQLVQRLLLLGVIAVAVIPGATHGIDFVNENDAGGNFGGLLEQVTHPAGTHAHEHLYKVRAGDGEEGNPRLSCHSLGKQRLAGTGRANQQRTLGKLGADFGVLLGVVEEINDFGQGFLGFVLTGHILKGHAGLLFHIHFRFALAEAAHHALAAHAFGNHAHEHKQDGKGNGIVQNHHNHGIIFRDLTGDFHAHALQPLRQHQVIAAAGQTGIAGLLHGGRLGSLGFSQVDHAVIAEIHFCQIVVIDGFQKFADTGFGVLAAGDGIVHPADEQHQRQGNNQRRPDAALREIVHWTFLILGIFGFRTHNSTSPLGGCPISIQEFVLS